MLRNFEATPLVRILILLSLAVFSFEAQAGSGCAITKVSGDNQSGLVSNALSNSLVISTSGCDSYGVTWTSTKSDTFSNSASLTSTTVTLSSTSGARTITVTDGYDSSNTKTFTATGVTAAEQKTENETAVKQVAPTPTTTLVNTQTSNMAILGHISGFHSMGTTGGGVPSGVPGGPSGGKIQQPNRLDLSGLNLNIDGKMVSAADLLSWLNPGSGGGAGDPLDFLGDRVSIYMNGNFSFGDRPTSSRVAGYDFRMFGTTLGLDYRVLDGLYTGMAFGYEGNGSEFADYKGDTDSDTYSLNVYASLNQFENYYLDLLFRYGWTDYNARRNFTDPGSNSNSATANYDGIDYSFVVNSGYRFVFGELSVQPYGRFEYVAVDTDSYRESAASANADSWLLDVSQQRMQSLRTNFGAQASYAVSTGFGVLVPSVNVEWVHEYKNKSRTVTSTLFNQTGTSTASLTDNPDRDFINVGASLNGVFAQGLSGFVSYRAQAGNSLLFQQQVNAGLRLEL